MHHSYDVAGPARKNLLVFLTFTLQRKNAMSASLCFYNVHYQENLRNSCLRNYSRCSETFMFAQAGCTAIAFWTFVFPLGFFFLVNKLVHTNWCALIPVAKGGTVCARACVCVHPWVNICVCGWMSLPDHADESDPTAAGYPSLHISAASFDLFRHQPLQQTRWLPY